MSELLIAQRKKYIVERGVLANQLKALKPVQLVQKKKLQAQIKELSGKIATLTAKIQMAQKTASRVGIQPLKPTPSKIVSPFQASAPTAPFQASTQSLMTKPVVRDDMPIRTVQSMPIVKSSVPKIMPTVEVMPNFQKEEIPVVLEETEIIEDAPEGFDFMTFVEDNKIVLGLGLLAGAWFAFGRKQTRSNPKRKSKVRKSRKVSKVRKNKRRSGYHRS